MKSCVGVVLAGGQGRRLGRTKGDLEVDGASLADRAASVLWPFCSTVLISTGDHPQNPAPRFTEVRDQPPAGRGPLAGIAAFSINVIPVSEPGTALLMGLGLAGIASASRRQE